MPYADEDGGDTLSSSCLAKMTVVFVEVWAALGVTVYG